MSTCNSTIRNLTLNGDLVAGAALGKLPIIVFLLWLMACNVVFAREPLTLPQAERLAIDDDPIVARKQANQMALSEKAVAAYAWPDPKLRFGVSNISTRTWDFEQEAMTQGVVGLSQAFPPSGSVGAKRDQFMALASSEGHAVDVQKLQTLRSVRTSWLEVYYQYQAEILVQKSLNTFEQLKDVTRFQYRAGRGHQHDVVRAQLEQSRMEDRITAIRSKWESALAKLKKWLGSANFQKNLDMSFPLLPTPPNGAQIQARLDSHPWLLRSRERIKAAQNGVHFADAQHNPTWMLDVKYGYRGEDQRGIDRDDLLSAMIVMDLPLFSSSKQDKLLSASQSNLTASKRDLDERYRQLIRMLDDNLAKFKQIEQRILLFDDAIMPQAEQNTEASVKAYKSGVMEFDVLVRARLTELDSQLQYLKLNVDRAKVEVKLLYLAGE